MSATTHGAPDRGRVDVVRIPLTITATGSGYETDGVLVAVAVSQLDDLMAETDRLRDLLQTVASTIHEEWSMSYAHQLLEGDRDDEHS